MFSAERTDIDRTIGETGGKSLQKSVETHSGTSGPPHTRMPQMDKRVTRVLEIKSDRVFFNMISGKVPFEI